MTSQYSAARRFVRAMIAIAATVALVGSGAVAASAGTLEPSPETASLSGTVTDAATGTAIAGASVVVLSAQGAEAGSTATGSTGGYTVTGLAAGEYRVSISAAPSHDPVFWPSGSTLDSAEPITLAAGEARAAVDAALAPTVQASAGSEGVETDGIEESDGAVSDTTVTERPADETAPTESAGTPAQPEVGSSATVSAEASTLDVVETGAITGTVTRADTGAPVQGGSVWVSGPTFALRATAADGSYSITGLVPGDYSVRFVQFGPDLVSEYWNGAREYDEATLVTVVAGAIVSHIDASLDVGGSITGSVTRADTGAPVEGVSVNASSPRGSGFATTGADGTYVLSGSSFDGLAPGEYTLSFTPTAESGLVSEYWEDAHDRGEASQIAVALGETVTGISPSLDAGGSVTGVVTRADTGAPVPGVTVYTSGGPTSARGTTGEDGSYALRGLASGDYRVYFSPDSDSGLAYEYWENSHTLEAATSIDVALGATISNVNASLAAVGSISGTVTRADTGGAVEGRWVYAIDSEGRNSFAKTGVDGSYTIPGVAPGSYKVQFLSSPGLATQFWEGAQSSDEATPVNVAAGEAVQNIDASLLRSATIAGQVSGYVASAGSASLWVWVNELDASGSVVSRTYTVADDDDGRYVLSLDPGEYVLEVDPWGAVYPAAAQFYDNAPTLSEAQRITVGPEAELSGYDFTLAAGINIEGNVSFDGPTPVLGAQAIAYRWSGDAWHEARRITALGDYSFSEPFTPGAARLPAGTYTVGFEATGYCTQYWDAKSDLSDADSFAPAPSYTQDGIDATLAVGCDLPSVVPGSPTVSGTPQVGETLTAVPGDWTPAPVELSYQWLADGETIAGATSPTLALTAEHEGARISVEVTGSRPGYESAEAVSPEVGPVAPRPLPSVVPGTPSITGETVAGEVLTAVPGTWSPAGATLAYQWAADGVDVPAATGATFVPGDAEVGKDITVTVTGSASGYVPASATSTPVGPIEAAPLRDLEVGTPSISGTAKVGETLTASPGTWGPRPVSLSYQWLVDGEPVPGATDATFALDGSVVGTRVSVTVLGTKPGYNRASATSPEVGPIAEGELTTVVPVINGTPQVGQPLTAESGEWGPAPVALAFQWVVDGEPVEGATETQFTPDAAHLGKTVTVVVTGTKPGYTTASETSAATSPVIAGVLDVSDPRIVGIPRVGQEISVDASAWGPAPLELSYQWLADGEPIEGVTGDRFTPDASLVGTELSVRVSAAKPGYESAERTVVIGEIPPSLAVSTPRAERGQQIVVTGQYFIPGEPIRLELHSDPIEIGSVFADAEGGFTTEVTVPLGAELGDHDVVATGLDSGLVASTPLEVFDPAAPVPTPTPTAGAGTGKLSSTGMDLPTAALVIALALLAVGGVLVRRRRVS